MKVISVVLLILLLAGLYLWQEDRPQHRVQSMAKWPLFAQSKVTDIRVIHHDGEEIILHKRDVWMLAEQLADAEAVQHILNDLQQMKPIRVVSRNVKQYARLEVNEGATRVILSGEGVTFLDAYIGKQGSDLISTYVRLHDSQEVVAVNKALVWQVNRQPDSWQKKESSPVVVDQDTDTYAHSL